MAKKSLIVALIILAFTLGRLTSHDSEQLSSSSRTSRESNAVINQKTTQPSLTTAGEKFVGGEKSEQELPAKQKVDEKIIMSNLVKYYKPDVFNYNSTLISQPILESASLSEAQGQRLNELILDKLDKIKGLEKQSAKIVTKSNGDRVIVIEPYDGSGIQAELQKELSSLLNEAQKNFIMSALENSKVIGGFGRYRSEISAGIIQTNLNLNSSDDTPMDVLFDEYRGNNLVNSGSSPMTLKTYKDRFGYILNN